MSCCFSRYVHENGEMPVGKFLIHLKQHRQEWHQRKIFRQIYKFLRLDLQNKWLLYIITNRGRKKILFGNALHRT